VSIEFIGIAATRAHTETEIERASGGPPVNADYLRALARAHEDAGFDRVLVAHSSASPDGFIVADQVLTGTDRLGVLLAHRPGFVAPTLAARKFATLDAFHPGRVALHVITGGDDADQARDGDITDKPTRYRRTDEFLDVLRLEWESTAPFDYDGEFYQVRGGLHAGTPGGPGPGLLRRRLRGRDTGRGRARRRVRVLGRAAGRHRRTDRRGTRRRRPVRPRPPVQRQPAAHPGRDRDRGVAATDYGNLIRLVRAQALTGIPA
jgi:alkanesulfonate monooxygenase SsuD/methylene tetrahydromethanopterin reductase-like flavin-dependent oxidoreductase (luciferase family)